MKDKASILFLEDVAADFVLANQALSQSGLSLETKQVDSKEQFARELHEHPPDLILSDHGLHDFDAFSALALAREKAPQTPFIFVTGSLGEEAAVRAFKSGATDYVPKHRLTDLAPAVRRALRLAEEQRLAAPPVEPASARESKLEAGAAAVSERPAVRELDQGDAVYRRMVQSVRDYAIFLLDAEGRVSSWNRGAEIIHGYSSEEVIGQQHSKFFVPEDIQAGKPAQLLQTAATEGCYRDEGWRLRKDGSRFWASVVVTALRDDAGRLTGFSKVMRDMTERKRIEDHLTESEARKSAILAAAIDAIICINHQGLIREWNPAAEKTFGYRRDEALGRELAELIIPPALREQHRRGLARYLATGVGPLIGTHYQSTGRRADGSQFPVEIAITRISPEDPPMFIGFVRDITERKRAEDQIRRLNADLEEQVIQRTSQLEAANKELEAFSHSVSHDLRAPLRHIDGFIDLLQQRAGEQLDSTSREYLGVIAESGQQMRRLIDALLAFSRMGRAAMRQGRVSMASLVRSVIHDLRYDLEGRNVEWVIGHLPEVIGDPSLLRQVWLNLFSNALKYTRTRPAARIEIGATSNIEETVFFVRDNGIGFDMQYADRLFGVFQRLNPSPEFEGIGIGLANVRRIIQRHGGKTWAHGAPDRGATFYFSLPKAGNAETV